ncbi:cyclic nucleotide-binding domain-containing protein [Streptomyces lunaelactis]|uniref:cyclic nucleotide-binding domain-containing protein n=1 Tax=Streptomyces lunaelactis TaxID=1535768 RepID=UPI001584885D|nr:cyclic nucleotide-binding domain-containing protein [Streptomyces lunaelactis]NUK04146.1 cyclic nucleotide-binding domain-containing protein [Streptomyces lunaelactis]NUK06491.1 cyclic nucleotide-binding domain-containing protein [Streptomyces lunaelactis]NUK16652.1 cyclic nucleotide-binding domain-containing protein [Streptomyces lunaelactis]NUK23159.1 cyclic nucleotide-binding domain-containing protein [Streptomyces lunaelactis]NUK35608.1 cyclic nucleotide-binding domain-containing protei
MTTTTLLNVLPKDGRDRLMSFSHDVTFPAGTRIFEDGGRADQFWIIRTGSVNLDLQAHGQRAATVETLGHGDLLGWSWLVPPYIWRLGAEAFTFVRAHEFDAAAVRALCNEDPALGLALTRRVLEVIAHRLQITRIRLLDQYAPHGSGTTLTAE